LIHTSRGVAAGDVNNDGGIDLVVTNRDAAPYLLMNSVERGNWVRFKVRSGDRDAHGAIVSVTVNKTRLSRDVQPSASYLAASDPRVHFGLGDAVAAKSVTVRWPGGDEETFGDFNDGATYELHKGKGETVSR
jgi:hypothetical protein